jgi:PTS system D-glucosamine-specific IIC component
MTFSGGIIDLTLFGILQGNAKTNWLWIPLVGVGYFIVYFLLFRVMIRKFNYVTPGREADDEETRLFRRADVEAKKVALAEGGTIPTEPDLAPSNVYTEEREPTVSELILEGLGGHDNVENLDCCATRLRVTVKDGEAVDESLLKRSGAAGVIKRGGGIQIVYGPQVAVIKSELEEYMSHFSDGQADK